MISVCMATFNGEKYLKKQIDSILHQLSLNDEIIVSDNCSKDKTKHIIQNYKDKRIKYHEFEKKSIVLNFQNSINKAKGEYIFLCDQDDIWEEGKVKVMMEELQKCPLVISDCKIINENGIELYHSFFEIRSSGKGILKNLIRNSYLGCCMAFRKEIIKSALPFPVNLPMHDWWIGLIAEIFHETKFINNNLVMYRRHGDNASPTDISKEKVNLFFMFKTRITIVVLLLKRYLKLRTKKN